MIYTKLSLREFRYHPGRALLTLLSVVIAVAAVVAVTLAADTTRRAFDDIYHTVAGKAALEVVAPLGKTFDESLAQELRDIPGVAVVSPIIERPTVVFIGDRRIQLSMMGVVPEYDNAVHSYEIVEGKSLEESQYCILDSAFAKSAGIKLDEEITLLTKKGMKPAYISGLFQRQGTATTGQGAVLLMPLKSAQFFFNASDQLDNCQIVLKPGANEETVLTAIKAKLPEGVTANRPASRSQLAEETSLSTDQAMRMARFFSLLVAVFIIINTFLINITQRRRQLGILRAIGATQLQIGTMIYSEALLMGVVGSVFGFIVGVGAAQLLSRAMGRLYQTTLPGVELTAWPFILAGLIGMGLSLIGAALPARRARQLSPLEAMRVALPSEMEGFSRWLMIVGTALLALGGFLLTASVTGRLPVGNSIWGALLILAGLVFVFIPASLGPLSSAVDFALRPLLRIESRMGRRQLLRNRSRTTLTVGVVFIAISTGVALANSVIDNVNDVRNWYKTAFIVDFLVRAGAPDMATGTAADLPDGIGEKLAAVPGVETTEAIRLVKAKVGEESPILAARDFLPESMDSFDLVSGDRSMLLEKLRDGEIMVGSVLAKLGYKVGDSLPLVVGDTTKDLTIAAIVNDYQAGGLIMYMDRAIAQQQLGIDGISAYAVRVNHEQMESTRAELQKLTQDNGLMLQPVTDIQKKIDGMMAGVVGALWGMVVLGLLVAAFGVTNTLTMNVLEQTREIGLLRIIAMTRDQVRKTIFAQALMMGLMALIPGAIAGVVIAYMINLATYPITGHPVEFVFHPWLFGGSIVVGMIIVALAAWFPAERAARLALPQALRYT